MCLSSVVNSRRHPRQACKVPPSRPSRSSLRTSAYPVPLRYSCLVLSSLVATLSSPLYFQRLPIIKFCNPFLLITIRIAGSGYTLTLSLHSLQRSLQIRSFVFNELQVAPPTTLFLSWFCIVARGWVHSRHTVHKRSLYALCPSLLFSNTSAPFGAMEHSQPLCYQRFAHSSP